MSRGLLEGNFWKAGGAEPLNSSFSYRASCCICIHHEDITEFFSCVLQPRSFTKNATEFKWGGKLYDQSGTPAPLTLMKLTLGVSAGVGGEHHPSQKGQGTGHLFLTYPVLH